MSKDASTFITDVQGSKTRVVTKLRPHSYTLTWESASPDGKWAETLVIKAMRQK